MLFFCGVISAGFAFDCKNYLEPREFPSVDSSQFETEMDTLLRIHPAAFLDMPTMIRADRVISEYDAKHGKNFLPLFIHRILQTHKRLLPVSNTVLVLFWYHQALSTNHPIELRDRYSHIKDELNGNYFKRKIEIRLGRR